MRLLIVALLLASPAVTSAASPSARGVLAAHDCCGRLANTTIRKLGTLQAGRATYAIYNLRFVNPETHHGMQRVAIFGRANRFLGAYQVENFATSLKDHRVLFEGPRPFDRAVIAFTKSGPPRQAFIQGEVRDLEDTI